MKTNKFINLLIMCFSLGLITTKSFAVLPEGGSSGVGGGGDASEARVNEIRSDILSWINRGGAVGLKLSFSLVEYETKMKEILKNKKVVLGFVENDDEKDDELQVNVNRVPKTCRGFLSQIDSKAHILCNISRFEKTPPADQYRLIHHEYAGLAGIEKNEDAASDYEISTQITDFLREEKVLKLAVIRTIKIKPCGQKGNLNERIKDCKSTRNTHISEIFNSIRRFLPHSTSIPLSDYRGYEFNYMTINWSKVAELEDGAQIYLDNLTQKFWFFELEQKKLDFENARNSCLTLFIDRKDLIGKKWHIPSIKDFRSALKNGMNSQYRYYEDGFTWSDDNVYDSYDVKKVYERESYQKFESSKQAKQKGNVVCTGNKNDLFE